MSFGKALSLSDRIVQYIKLFEDTKSEISNISDETALNQIKTNISSLNSKSAKIVNLLNTSNDPNIDTLRNNYNLASSEFESLKDNWNSIIQTKDKEFANIREQEQAQKSSLKVLSDEQIQQQQQNDELDYTLNQAKEIGRNMKEINDMQHLLDDKIKEDHVIVVKIDDKVDKAKDSMIDGNKELDKAESDQKKCDIS